MKQKQSMIDSVGDLVDSLEDAVESTNERLAENGVSERISVLLDSGRVYVKVNDKEEFSTSVDDKNARSAYNSVSSAIKRAMKSLISSVRSSGDSQDEPTEGVVSESALGKAFDEAFGRSPDKPFERRGFKKPKSDHYTGGKTFRQELIWTVNFANSRAGEEGLSFLFEYKLDDGRCSITGNGESIVDVLVDFDVDKVMTDEIYFGPMKKVKVATWRRLDSMKKGPGGKVRRFRQDRATEHDRVVSQNPQAPVVQQPQKKPFAERLSEVVAKANEELAKYSADKLSVSTDSAGVYVTCGKLPVVSEPVGVKDDDSMIKSMNDKVWDFVHSARGAFERRQNDSERISMLEYDTACDKALHEKFAKTEDKPDDSNAEDETGEEHEETGDWKYFHDPAVAESIVRAVKRSVKPFNRNAGVRFYGLSLKLGEEAITMSIRGFSRGVVVMTGGEPCYITMFPLLGSNKTTEETVTYLEAQLKAMCEKRMEYLNALKSEFERSDRLKELSNRRNALRKENEALDEALKAMAM